MGLETSNLIGLFMGGSDQAGDTNENGNTCNSISNYHDSINSTTCKNNNNNPNNTKKDDNHGTSGKNSTIELRLKMIMVKLTVGILIT